MLLNPYVKVGQLFRLVLLIVFDLDYTLVKVKERHIVIKTNETQRDLGLPEVSFRDAMLMWTEYHNEELFARLSGFQGGHRAYFNDHYWRFDSPELRAANTVAYKGARKVVRGLISGGKGVHVLTGTQQDVAFAQARVLRVPNLPILALGKNPRFVDLNKPHPDGLIEVMDHHGVRPEQTLMVGDSESDAGCALAAGTHFAFFNARRNGCGRTAQIAEAEIDDWTKVAV